MNPAGAYDFAVIIPVLADRENLRLTLRSLRACGGEFLRRTVCVIAVNANERCAPRMLEDNRLLLRDLQNRDPEFSSGAGREIFLDLAVKASEGVGRARRCAVEAAATVLNPRGLVFSLDADTLVEANYLACGAAAFAAHPEWAGASVNFRHRLPENPLPGQAAALAAYEKWLAGYAAGLAMAGSPYAYNVMGSAMVWRHDAGVRAGGVRPRAGGEDFYFLQALRKVGEVGAITGTTVHPLGRLSARVPFGTGPRLREIMDGKFDPTPYPEELFRELKLLLDAVADGEPEEFASTLMNIDKFISDWLAEMDFPAVWSRILRNTSGDRQARIRAFHCWFDAFKTLKFIHRRRESLSRR